MSTVLEERESTEAKPRRARRASGVPTRRSTRSKAAQRALDRRDRRTAVSGPATASTSRRFRRIPLVIPVLTLVVGALALTLYLSTKSAQDSYAIDALREQNNSLEARRDAAKREYDLVNSAPELAKKAEALGMVQGTAGAQLVVGPDGKTRLVGTARPATGGPLPDLNPEPNPVDKIDADKVDDSQGLGGSTAPTTTAPTTTAPSATAPTTTAPTAPSNGPTTNVVPNTRNQPTAPRQQGGAPTRRVNGPTTNVIPPNSATPRANPSPAR